MSKERINRTPKTICLLVLMLLLSGCEEKPEIGLPMDGDGNYYDTIVIGTQVWLAENLKTTKYTNGLSIPLLTESAQWTTTTLPAYCWYNNQPEQFKDLYGALYNWHAVQKTTLCPVGYHVPTTEEWNMLVSYLGGQTIAGGKLKLVGTEYWKTPNAFATNEFGFSAMPGGGRGDAYGNMTIAGTWWSRSPGINDGGNGLRLTYVSSEASLTGLDKTAGASVRCLKDN
jgi:uncharacterized protein (TIGR02145 family)